MTRKIKLALNEDEVATLEVALSHEIANTQSAIDEDTANGIPSDRLGDLEDWASEVRQLLLKVRGSHR